MFYGLTINSWSLGHSTIFSVSLYILSNMSNDMILLNMILVLQKILETSNKNQFTMTEHVVVTINT